MWVSCTTIFDLVVSLALRIDDKGLVENKSIDKNTITGDTFKAVISMELKHNQ